MDGRDDNWELVAAIAAMVIDTAESVESLHQIMTDGPLNQIAAPLPPGDKLYALPAGNAAAMALLKQHRPDLLPALRARFVARKAHLYAAGKIKPEPLPEEKPQPAPPANVIRRRA